jgi:hypothetical protein
LRRTTSGSYNTSVGSASLYNNTSGNKNTAVGYRANYTVTTASGETSIGYEAGLSQTVGANTNIGYRAGRSIVGDGTGGQSNVCIGRDAGYDTVAMTGGRWNVIIGDYCRTNSGNAEAQIVMGYNVQANAENSFCFGKSTTDSAIAFGATSISAPSDGRYKKDITDATAGLSFINDLRPVTYKWKNEGDLPSDHRSYVEGSTTPTNNPRTQHGFIAQEVKEAIDNHPEIEEGFGMWKEDSFDGRQRLADGALIPLLVKAVQELSAENKALMTRIQALENA